MTDTPLDRDNVRSERHGSGSWSRCHRQHRHRYRERAEPIRLLASADGHAWDLLSFRPDEARNYLASQMRDSSVRGQTMSTNISEHLYLRSVIIPRTQQEQPFFRTDLRTHCPNRATSRGLQKLGSSDVQLWHGPFQLVVRAFENAEACLQGGRRCPIRGPALTWLLVPIQRSLGRQTQSAPPAGQPHLAILCQFESHSYRHV